MLPEQSIVIWGGILDAYSMLLLAAIAIFGTEKRCGTPFVRSVASVNSVVLWCARAIQHIAPTMISWYSLMFTAQTLGIILAIILYPNQRFSLWPSVCAFFGIASAFWLAVSYEPAFNIIFGSIIGSVTSVTFVILLNMVFRNARNIK